MYVCTYVCMYIHCTVMHAHRHLALGQHVKQLTVIATATMNATRARTCMEKMWRVFKASVYRSMLGTHKYHNMYKYQCKLISGEKTLIKASLNQCQEEDWTWGQLGWGECWLALGWWVASLCQLKLTNTLIPHISKGCAGFANRETWRTNHMFMHVPGFLGFLTWVVYTVTNWLKPFTYQLQKTK